MAEQRSTLVSNAVSLLMSKSALCIAAYQCMKVTSVVKRFEWSVDKESFRAFITYVLLFILCTHQCQAHGKKSFLTFFMLF